ncbi:DOPA 4,5-dioxygenase family protein [Neptuniibacter halophilus]|uniref:DOPA 4,5-dioxygenase family protein n=1 Tax=Neptuniibacter halophilus TaxID=651666 RepID=UPI0025735239|nr:DOPA 4,5-dioxygenase family protein [Neptuniibacter halophilus]
MSELANITGYHAHIYFDSTTLKQAEALCLRAKTEMGTTMGTVHQKPVGPHTEWSCLLTFPPEKIAEMLPWLILNRNGLTVFLHPETGDNLADHTEHVVWLGESKPLKTEMFLPG